MHIHFALGCGIAELMQFGKISIDTLHADSQCPHCIGEMIKNNDQSLFEFDGELYTVVFKFEPFEFDEDEDAGVDE